MKHSNLIIYLFLLSGFVTTPTYATALIEPEIAAVELQGSNVVIRVNVDAGFTRLIYETKTNLSSGQAWVPRKSMSLSGTAETVTLTVAINPDHGCFRVRCLADDPTSPGLFQGTSTFTPILEASGSSVAMPGVESTVFSRTPGGDTSALSNAPPIAGPDVVDSDVWVIKGDRLYFFNRYRGLQIVDITDPDTPVLLHTFSFAANGERMFALPGSEHVVLIANGWCNSTYNEQEVVVIDVSGDEARIVQRLTVPGYIRESRLIGDALFTGSSGYFPVTTSSNTVYESRTYLTSFDLSTPALAFEADQLFFSGYQGAIRAFPDYITVVTHNWFRGRDTAVILVEIDHTDGSMTQRLELDTQGYVRNEYMLNVRNGVLSVFADDTSAGVSRLTNYDFDGRQLGQVEVGLGERLFSARFHEDTVYAVTFRRIDPLWIIDNSDPTSPQVLGELEVPGFSTHIEVLDGQIVTIGTESNRVAVSLFDTSDQAHPALLSRITIGDRFSWSEAQYEEQAFQVERDAGLIMVPFSSGSARGLQFIELTASNLVERGIVLTPNGVRRSALEQQRVLAITGTELLVVDPADLDHPQLTYELELARRINRVVHHRDHLIELDGSQSYYWGGSINQPLQVRSRSETNETPLASLDLDALALLGVERQGDLLYLLQADNQSGWYCCIIAGETPATPPSSNLVCTVVDLSALPQLRVAARIETPMTHRPYGSMQALWPTPQTLVWAPENSSYPIYFGGFQRGLIGFDLSPFYFPRSQLVAYDLPMPDAPVFASSVTLDTTNVYHHAGVYGAAAGKIYTGHTRWDFVKAPTNTTNTVHYGHWYSRNWLDVIDYLDPTQPLSRPSAELPGSFAGVSPNGRVVYSVENGRYHSTNNTWSTNHLHALGYDDVSLFELDSLPLGNQAGGNGSPLIHNDVLYVKALSSDTNNQVWVCALDATHQWVIHDRIDDPSWSTLFRKNDLLIQNDWSQIRFYSLTDPLHPAPLRAHGNSNNCNYANPNFGDGNSNSGFFIPNGLYGIDRWTFGAP